MKRALTLAERDLWCKALRSGEFKQGQNHLRTDENYRNGESDYSFCCLGVLCEVLNYQSDSTEFIMSHTEELALPTYELVPEKIQSQLALMNDDELDIERKTFNEIADYIEKEIQIES